MNNEIDFNEPLFPNENLCFSGITLRDYFAAKAMQHYIDFMASDEAVKSSYEIADLMLKERAK